jgi:hypothetical protein
MPPVQSSASDYVMELLAQLRPDLGPLPDRPGWLGRPQQGARPQPADSVLRLQGTQAGVPILAAGYTNSTEHGLFCVGGRSGSGLCQRGPHSIQSSRITLTFRLSARTASVSFCFKRGYNLPEPPPSKKQRTDSAQPDPDSDTTTGTARSGYTSSPLEAPISLTLTCLPIPGLTGQRIYSNFTHKDLDLLNWPEGVSVQLMAASRSANSWSRHV